MLTQEKRARTGSSSSLHNTLRAVGRLGVVLLAQLVLHAWAGALHAQDLASADQLPPVVDRPYRVQPGDVLQIKFFKTSQLNQTAPVGPDGGIFLPLIGRVEVLNRTIREINQELLTRYDKEMIDPQITLSVNQYSGMQVYVGGEVNVPGVQAYRGGLTLVQAVMTAGGFASTSRLKEVVLIRRSADQSPVGTLINVKEILRQAHFKNDVPLAPADVIFVPRKKISNLNLFIDQYITQNIPFSRFYPLID
ncbi:MAG: polysaccharide biosynthesis/export family protein [Acidobacteriota bacterium]